MVINQETGFLKSHHDGFIVAAVNGKRACICLGKKAMLNNEKLNLSHLSKL